MISINYTLKSDDGLTIDKTSSDPIIYLTGDGKIVPGLERALLGRRAGDIFHVSIPPEDGYGPIDKSLVIKVPKEKLDQIADLKVGAKIRGTSGTTSKIFLVTDIDEDHIILDGNHPLAGTNLNYYVQVMDVRLATKKEKRAIKKCCAPGSGCC